MSREIIKNGILDSLESIIEMVSAIDKHEDAIPQIETDILLERIRRLYADVLKLNDLTTSKVHLPKMHEPNSLENPPVMVSHSDEQKIKEIESIKNETSFKEEPKEDIQLEQAITENQALAPNNEPIIKNEPQHDLFENTTTLSDKLKKESVSLHDKISIEKKQEDVIFNRINKKPVDNLRKAIGINDKFLFINHLFSGDMKAYDQLIEQLNAASSLQKALETIDTYTSEKNWDTSSSALIKLRDLTENKFQNQ